MSRSRGKCEIIVDVLTKRASEHFSRFLEFVYKSIEIRFRKVFVNGRNNKNPIELEFLKLVEIYFGRKKLKFNFLDETFDYNTVILVMCAICVVGKGRGLRT